MFSFASCFHMEKIEKSSKSASITHIIFHGLGELGRIGEYEKSITLISQIASEIVIRWRLTEFKHPPNSRFSQTNAMPLLPLDICTRLSNERRPKPTTAFFLVSVFSRKGSDSALFCYTYWDATARFACLRGGSWLNQFYLRLSCPPFFQRQI